MPILNLIISKLYARSNSWAFYKLKGLQKFQGKQDKEGLRNCSGLNMPTETWQLNAICKFWLDPGLSRWGMGNSYEDIIGTTDQI